MSSKVSVFTALYNHEPFVKQCLDSAINQTTPPSEIVVLDDASTDNSLAVLHAINNSLIRLITKDENLGGANTSKGLDECNGDYIAILNSDDAWDSEKIQKQLACISTSSNIGAVYTHICAIDEFDVPWARNSLKHQKVFGATNRLRCEWLNYFFLHGNPFCASSALVKRECLNKLGSFNGGYIQLQDLDMWVRIALNGYDLCVIEEPLTYYRMMRNSSNMSSANAGNRATYSFEYAKILRNYWNLSSLEELVSIFPELKISDKADDSLILYYLAQYSARLPHLHHQLFALETMSEWGGNYDAMSLAHKCHGFDFRAYREFMAHGPIRTISRMSIRHNANSLILKLLPSSVYQKLKGLLS